MALSSHPVKSTKPNSIYWLLPIFTPNWQFSCWGSWLIPSSHPILISLSKGHWVTPLIFSSKHGYIFFQSVRFSSVNQSCLTLWPQHTWTAAHQISLSIANSWSLFKLMSKSRWCHPTISSSVVPFSSCLVFPSIRVSSSHQVAKVLELQLRHQFFQWIFRIDFL